MWQICYAFLQIMCTNIYYIIYKHHHQTLLCVIVMCSYVQPKSCTFGTFNYWLLCYIVEFGVIITCKCIKNVGNHISNKNLAEYNQTLPHLLHTQHRFINDINVKKLVCKARVLFTLTRPGRRLARPKAWLREPRAAAPAEWPEMAALSKLCISVPTAWFLNTCSASPRRSSSLLWGDHTNIQDETQKLSNVQQSGIQLHAFMYMNMHEAHPFWLYVHACIHTQSHIHIYMR